MNNYDRALRYIENGSRNMSCNFCCFGSVGPTEASATITGTAPNFVLNLTIPQGPTGPTSEEANFADFYALMPGDNSAPIALGEDVNFPQDGESSNTTITRLSDNSFNLAEIGTYRVFF